MDANQFQQFLAVVKDSFTGDGGSPIEKIKREALRAPGGPRLGTTTNFANWKSLWEIYRAKMQLDVTINQEQVPADFQARLLLSSVDEGVIPKIKLAMDGSQAWNMTILNAAETNQNVRFNNWLKEIENLFQPPSESRLAKVDFKSRVQSHAEDISSYFTSKLALWESAYGATARDTHFDLLLDETVKGIYSLVVKREIRGRKIETVEDLRKELVDVVAVERLRIEDGSSESTSLDGLAATTRSIGHMGNYEMMDTSSVNRVANRDDRCRKCNKHGHFARDCWSKTQTRDNNYRGRGSYRGQGKQDHSNIICDYCKIKGHIKRNCRKKMRDEQNRNQRGNNYQRGHRGYGRGGHNRDNRRGVRTIQEDENEGQETEEDHSFLDNGEELTEGN